MNFVITFFLCLITWILFSGKFDPFHFSLGIISCLIVTFASTNLVFPGKGKFDWGHITRIPSILGYLMWLNLQVILANIHVFALAMKPNVRAGIGPRIIRFKTCLKSDFAKVVFANSITLTPGTVTVRIDDDEFVVHAIDEAVAKSLPGEMEERISKVFDR